MFINIFFVFLIIGISFLDSVDASAETRRTSYEAKLTEIRKRNISTLVPPLPEEGKIPIDVNFKLHRVIELDADIAVLRVIGTIRLAWYDPRYEWNGGPKSLILQAKDIWIPHFILSSATEDVTRFTNSVLLQRSGQASLERTAEVAVGCGVDVSRFPSDIQHCTFQFMAPIGFREIMMPVHQVNYTTNRSQSIGEEWSLLASIHDVIDIQTTDSNGELETIPAYRLSILLGRSHSFYLLTLIIPTILLNLIMLVPYALPPQMSQPKLLIPVTTFLSVNIYMLLLEKSLPKSNTIPVLGEVYAILLASGVITTIIQTFSVKFYSCRIKRVPRVLFFIYLRVLAFIVCYGACHGDEHIKVINENQEKENIEDSDMNDNELIRRLVHKQWFSIGRINDRCGLIISIILSMTAFVLLFIRCYAFVEIPAIFRSAGVTT